MNNTIICSSRNLDELTTEDFNNIYQDVTGTYNLFPIRVEKSFYCRNDILYVFDGSGNMTTVHFIS